MTLRKLYIQNNSGMYLALGGKWISIQKRKKMISIFEGENQEGKDIVYVLRI